MGDFFTGSDVLEHGSLHRDRPLLRVRARRRARAR